ncbi:MAG: tRNA (adenosine(37)-N6)-threonylcarbamoyltransferase complex ATPase subunit type 1 TsaE [Bacteroidales bacterium]|nr:tRNA (adenosine(37)-N6)-threonylcarbamoyltransferase complex ATPase subunit type 1 TsaE [Bacteroidales bacterium]
MTIKAELDNIREVAQQLLTLLGDEKIVAFYGEMGSGKTTLIKAMCECLECVDAVNSPTFAIINEYFTKNGTTVYHFDFYRLKNIREALDIGVEEYLYSGHFCFLEWPEQIEDLLPENHVKVRIEKGEDVDTRTLTVVRHEM